MNFTKIHHSPDKDTIIEWFEVSEKGTAHKQSIESKEPPDVALPDAFKAFVPLIARACDLPEPWEQGLTVIGLSFSTEQQKGKPSRRGVIVTFQYKPDAFLSRMTCNTPLLKDAVGDETDEEKPGVLPKAWKEPIAALEEAAVKFIQGARSQQDLALFAGAAK